MSNVSQWETSAPNNDAAPPDGAPEGMAANTVNDTMREMMAAVARWYQDTNGSLVTGGAGDAYTLSTNNNNSSLTDLPLVVFVANRANTGAATLNVDGLGAKSLRFGGVALAAGVLQEDVAYIAIYNAEDDAFDIVGSPTRDASQITTGELDDDRLSDNVPLKDATNTFSGDNTFSIATIADLTVTDSVTLPSAEIADADILGNLNIRGNVTSTGTTSWIPSGTLIIGSTSDVTVSLRGGGDGAAFQINQGSQAALIRAGGVSGANTVASFAAAEIQFDVALFDMNGNADISGTLAVGGAVRAGTAATSTSATLAAGQIHHRSENTTVPSMNAGQWVAVQNTSTSSITLSEGSGVTLELGGTTTTGNRTLLAKGFAFIYFRANGVGVVHGSGVT